VAAGSLHFADNDIRPTRRLVSMSKIIPLSGDHDRTAIVAIINAAAEAYRGVITVDRWHEPYMPRDELDREIDAGVVFWGYEEAGSFAGVMGIQSVRDVDLIRHAYVLPGSQRRGIGGVLLRHLQQLSTRGILIGTWEAADWAIRFYMRHGFELVAPARKTALLKTYWDFPDRQMEVSVVLANPPVGET
jgi:GNAT superfamily N-acetyltransferase